MKRQVQITCFLISGLSVIAGLGDILVQFLDGDEVRWRTPLILIGLGVGLPTIVFPFYEPAPENSDDLVDNENDLSHVYNESPGFLSGSSGGSSPETYDYDHDNSD